MLWWAGPWVSPPGSKTESRQATMPKAEATVAEAVSISEALRKLTFLEGRTPTTSAAEASKAFSKVSSWGPGEGGVFVGGFEGTSAWERHPRGDELVQIIRGSTKLTIMRGGNATELSLNAGELTVVPRGLWHRFVSDSGVTVLTVTPQPTEHSSDERPPDTV